jgi:hypothetical protein
MDSEAEENVLALPTTLLYPHFAFPPEISGRQSQTATAEWLAVVS